MKKYRIICFVFLLIATLSSCKKIESEEAENTLIDYEKIKSLYKNEIEYFYNSLEDYKKDNSKVLIFDIDNNKIPELFLSEWEGEYQVYTINDEKIVHCGKVTAPFYEFNNELISFESFGNSSEGCRVYSLEDNKINSETIFYKDANGIENLPKFEKKEDKKSFEELKKVYTENPLKCENIKNIDDIDKIFFEM